MKKTLKIFILTIIAIFAITFTNSSMAIYEIVYQEDTIYKYETGKEVIVNIRKMENYGQVMGLNESINSDLTPTTSNNIDVHLQKNTEYGAMILFAASEEYGKKPEANDTTTFKESRFVRNGTTTGNIYGVYMDDYSNSWEWVAAGGTSGDRTYSMSLNSKYVNRYTSNNVEFPGDAILYWHENSRSEVSNSHAMVRGGPEYGVFMTDKTFVQYVFASRASVVCGVGF